jgi:dolichol-phosphate mannosyltransferase
MEMISVVSPVYGCAVCLEDLADRVAAAIPSGHPFELILVDDASPDGAWDRIVELSRSRPWLVGLRLSRNFGQHAAISAGIRRARGDWTIVMDCDLQDVPEEIPRLWEAASSKGLDVVFAQRVVRKDGLAKRIGSAAFFSLLSWLTGVKQDASTANFGIYKRVVIDAINEMPERDRSFPLMVKWAGFKSGAIPVSHAERAHGRSSYSLGRLVRLATVIVLSYSDKPLRLVAATGLAFAVAAVLMVAFSIWRWLVGDIAVAGFTSLMASIWLVGGAVMFSLGVVGLYVGQVFKNVQGRPNHIVSMTTQSSKEG